HGLCQVSIRWHGEGKPDVEMAVSLVIVADAWVFIYDLGAGVEGFVGDSHGDQRGLIAQTPRVENGAYLADDILIFETANPPDDVVL
ncbi:hypothetical protein L9G16_21025, partial [Shewanella sp. A25]|nr:hypothetical protein [Shewanella shenzhenensis]